MTRDLLLSMLRAGDNGDQILQILETLSDGFDCEDDAEYGTLQEIQF